MAFVHLPAAIQHIKAKGVSQRREWPAGPDTASWWTRGPKVSFEDELAKHGGSFIGREWLYQNLHSWVARPQSRLLLLTADAGVGKSAIAAQMTARLNVRGVHFCLHRKINSCRPATWISGLVAQLAAQFPAYRRCIEQLPPPDWSQSSSLFSPLIADPLRECADEIDITEPWVFVLDGLDESQAVVGPELVDVLAESVDLFPEWLRLIVTSRPDRQLLAALRLDGVHRDHLDAEGKPNLGDVEKYVTAQLKMSGHVETSDRQLVARITNAASGNFLFARLTLNAITDPDAAQRLSLAELGQMPSKLGGLYHAMFRKRFSDLDRYESGILPLLDCLVAAQGPLPETVLIEASGLDRKTAKRGLRALSQFLNQGPEGLTLFHKSVADWLSDESASAQFAAIPESGHAQLSDAGWKQYGTSPKEMSLYLLSHLGEHLAACKRWDNALELLTDVLYLEARTQAGQVFELLRDIQSSLENSPADPRFNHLALLGKTLRRHIYFLSMHPSTTFQCLWNSCWWHEGTLAHEHVGPQSQQSCGSLRIRDLLEKYRKSRTEEGSCVWLRSLRPPPVHLSLRSAEAAIFEGHKNRVRTIACATNGHCIVSGSADSTVRIWDASTGRERAQLKGHEGAVLGVAISRSVDSVASGGADGTVRLWDIDSSTETHCLRQHSARVLDVVFSPDGRQIVSVSEDGLVLVWDTVSGKVVQEHRGHDAPVLSVAYCPTGHWFASGSADKTIRVWHEQRNAEHLCLTGHGDWVRAITFSADGRHLASASLDRTIRIWDVEQGQELFCIEENDGPVFAVAYSEDGRQLASSSGDGTIRIWDACSSASIGVIPTYDYQVVSVAFLGPGRTLVGGADDGTVRLWDTTHFSGTSASSRAPSNITSVAFSPDGERIASSAEDSTVTLWSSRDGIPIRSMHVRGARIDRVEFLADNRHLACTLQDKTVQVWDTAAGTEIRGARGKQNVVWSVAFSPDGKSVVSGGGHWEEAVWIWDSQTGKLRSCLEGHDDEVLDVEFSPNGRFIASGARDQTVRIWDAITGEEVQRYCGHSGSCRAVAYSPDGECLASAGDDEVVRLWRASTGKDLQCLTGHSSRIRSLSFCCDGRHLASADDGGTILVSDLHNGRTVFCLEGHIGNVTCVRFSPDGRELLSGSHDKTVRRWCCETGEQLAICEGHQREVLGVSWIPGQDSFLSVARDGTLRHWDTSSAKEVARTILPDKDIASVTVSPDSRRVACGLSNSVVLVIDRATWEPLLSLQGPLERRDLRQMYQDVTWRARHQGKETVFEDKTTGNPVAWFPVGLSHLCCDPSGRTWAGANSGDVFLLKVEGDVGRMTGQEASF